MKVPVAVEENLEVTAATLPIDRGGVSVRFFCEVGRPYGLVVALPDTAQLVLDSP